VSFGPVALRFLQGLRSRVVAETPVQAILSVFERFRGKADSILQALWVDTARTKRTDVPRPGIKPEISTRRGC
jgi:hypothetical protein